MFKSRYIKAIIFFVCMSLLWVGGQAYARDWVDGTSHFREEKIFLAETLGQNKGTMLAPGLAEINPAYKIGDTRSFYANNMVNLSQYLLTASCHAVSDKAYIFVENGQKVSSAKLESLLASFDSIYDTITEHFGPPPDSIDKDPRVYILLMDIIDEKQADGARILGYFYALNQYLNSQISRWTKSRSNEIEMLYVDYMALDLRSDIAESIIAHEFVHLVQWARDPLEDIWVDEGIAVYAETMLGYKTSLGQLITAFASKPDTSLLTWSNTLADYGAAYLFFQYLSENFGGVETIASIVKSREQGVKGIEQVLAAQGKPLSFADIFSDWVVANYLDNPNLNNGIYGYNAIDIQIKPSIVENYYPINSKTSAVNPWTAQYIEFRKDQSDTLDLTILNDSSRIDIVARVIQFGDNTIISSPKSIKATFTSFQIPDDVPKAILVIMPQPNPPESVTRATSYSYSAQIIEYVTSVSPTAEKKITAWGKIKLD